MWNQKPSFRFEIDHFSEKKAIISSETFVSGGWEWYLTIYPKGDDQLADGHLSLFLCVANPTTFGTGWKRSISFYFVFLNQSDKELHKTSVASANYCPKTPGLGIAKALPLSTFQEKGFLDNDKLFIEVYINVTGGGDVSENKKKKIVDINGFQVFASQVTKVGNIFAEHPDIALDFKPTNQEVKTAYMNILLRVIKTLHKPPKSLSKTRLRKASSELSELMNVGFKLDWLKLKLEEVSLERKKIYVDRSRVQQLEVRVKHIELKLDEVSLGKKLSDDDNESRAQQVEKRIKDLELKLDELSLEKKLSDDDNESRAQQVEERGKDLELKLDEVSFGRKISDDAYESRSQQVEERVKNLELIEVGVKLDSLNTKLDEVSLERKKSDDGSLVQQLAESVKNIELMVSHLKVELDKKKNKSSADGFLLVET